MEITQEVLKELSKSRSQTGGTSLITMLISGGYSMSIVTKKLIAELSTSTNIKDKNVGKSVASALKSCITCIKSSNAIFFTFKISKFPRRNGQDS